MRVIVKPPSSVIVPEARLERVEPPFQKRRYCSIHAAASSRAAPSMREGALRPPAARDQPRALEHLEVLRDGLGGVANGSASSLTVASPSASRFRIARRVGSASAAKVVVEIIDGHVATSPLIK